MVYDYYKQNDVPFTSQAKSLGIRKNYPHKNPIKTYNTIIIKIKIIKKFLFFFIHQKWLVFFIYSIYKIKHYLQLSRFLQRYFWYLYKFRAEEKILYVKKICFLCLSDF